MGYRYFTKRTAVSLELKGYVKNTFEGVEIVAEGSEENLKLLLDECKKGPFFGRVDNVVVEWDKFKNEFEDFRITY
ncbi:acylphosphatase [Bacteroidota bacterium]